jgi:hypothetical protein
MVGVLRQEFASCQHIGRNGLFAEQMFARGEGFADGGGHGGNRQQDFHSFDVGASQERVKVGEDFDWVGNLLG